MEQKRIPYKKQLEKALRKEKAREEITKDMKISEILALNELIAPFLMQNGMGCVSCAASQAESLEEACEAHGIDVDDLTEDLNDVLREYMEMQEASRNA